jgi:hypothetical protein
MKKNPKKGAHPVFPFWRVHALRSKSEEPFQKKKTKKREYQAPTPSPRP